MLTPDPFVFICKLRNLRFLSQVPWEPAPSGQGRDVCPCCVWEVGPGLSRPALLHSGSHHSESSAFILLCGEASVSSWFWAWEQHHQYLGLHNDLGIRVSGLPVARCWVQGSLAPPERPPEACAMSRLRVSALASGAWGQETQWGPHGRLPGGCEQAAPEPPSELQVSGKKSSNRVNATLAILPSPAPSL